MKRCCYIAKPLLLLGMLMGTLAFGLLTLAESPESSSKGPPAVDAASEGWTIITTEDFEGDFPGAWEVFDEDGAANGEYHWAKRDCRPHGGDHSGWCVGGGKDGAGLACGALYPDNAHSWMVYGPFDLSKATYAEMRFSFWLDTEPSRDWLRWGASIDGQNWHWGGRASGSSGGWKEITFDLTDVGDLGDLTGQPAVWVAIVFESDLDTACQEGAFVDDIVLRAFAGGARPTPPLPPSLHQLFLPFILKDCGER